MAKILIVDDDIRVTTLLKRFLTPAGYEVTALNQSLKTIPTANATQPDLFILDIMMPQPDGFRLCRLLRAIPSFSYTPIIIITSLDISNSKAISFGADDFLAKPFDLDNLKQRMDFLLNKTRKIG